LCANIVYFLLTIVYQTWYRFRFYANIYFFLLRKVKYVRF